jgi:hypothetical protein
MAQHIAAPPFFTFVVGAHVIKFCGRMFEKRPNTSQYLLLSEAINYYNIRII